MHAEQRVMTEICMNPFPQLSLLKIEVAVPCMHQNQNKGSTQPSKEGLKVNHSFPSY